MLFFYHKIIIKNKIKKSVSPDVMMLAACSEATTKNKQIIKNIIQRMVKKFLAFFLRVDGQKLRKRKS